jgi:uncharacterized membrane protein YfcA
VIDPATAVGIFLLTAGMDALHAVYTKAVGDDQAVLAASSGSVIYIISAFSVIHYTQDWRYLIAMCTGSWVGTYVMVRRKRAQQARSKTTDS